MFVCVCNQEHRPNIKLGIKQVTCLNIVNARNENMMNEIGVYGIRQGDNERKILNYMFLFSPYALRFVKIG